MVGTSTYFFHNANRSLIQTFQNEAIIVQNAIDFFHQTCEMSKIGCNKVQKIRQILNYKNIALLINNTQSKNIF